MQTTPTHLASGAIVISVDELTAEDLQHLLDLKRSEPERIRAREEEELRHMLWRLLHRMPAETAAEIAELLSLDPPPDDCQCRGASSLRLIWPTVSAERARADTGAR